MPEEMYTYSNHKITGENGFSAEIISENHWKEITIEGSINVKLSLEGGVYVIRHNFLDEGYVRKNSSMEYEGNNFIIDHQGLKNLNSNRINFDIISGDEHVAFINVFRKEVNIDLDEPKYIIPVMIYIAIISKRLRTFGGKVHVKNWSTPLLSLSVSMFGGLITTDGLNVGKTEQLILIMVPIVALTISLFYLILKRGKLF